MSNSPKNDYLQKIKNEAKELNTKLKACRSDISKAQKDKNKLEEKLKEIIDSDKVAAEKLRLAIELEEKLEDEFYKKQMEIVKIETEEAVTKKFQEEIGKLKKGSSSTSEAEAEKVRKEMIKKLSSKESEIEKLKKELQEKTELIEKTRDAHDLLENPESGCYLLYLGRTDELKDKFVIPKNKVGKSFGIYKFGKSKSVTRRNVEHDTSFNKLIGRHLEMVHHKIISTYRYTDAENKIKKFFKDNGYTFISESTERSHSELVVICDTEVSEVKKFYDSLS